MDWAQRGILAAALAGMAAAPALAWEGRAMTPAEMAAAGALVVDIRAPEEWRETGVLPGAKLVTFTTAEEFLAEVGAELDPGQPLVLVCRSGRRSGLAAEALDGRTGGPVISLDGGMVQLMGEGAEVVRP